MILILETEYKLLIFNSIFPTDQVLIKKKIDNWFF